MLKPTQNDRQEKLLFVLEVQVDCPLVVARGIGDHRHGGSVEPFAEKNHFSNVDKSIFALGFFPGFTVGCVHMAFKLNAD